MASIETKLGDYAWHMHLEAIGFQSEGLLFKGPHKMLGLRGAAVPKEPPGPGLKSLKLDPKAGLDSGAP